ncbi:MAG: cell division protein FtsQ/DivIB [Acidobacteriaceae bacterium]
MNSRRATAVLDRDELAEMPTDSYRPTSPASRRVVRPNLDASVVEFPVDDLSEESENKEFLRSSRRVPVRRSLIPQTRFGRIAMALGVVLTLGLLGGGAWAVRNFLLHDPRFLIASSDAIQIQGNSNVTRPELLNIFGTDIGRNIFYVPLAERRAELEQLPWVEHATVMRLLPNRLRILVVERTPVAFVRQGSQIGLVDANGVLLNMPAAAMGNAQYSFPVVVGISSNDSLSSRAARMKIYQNFLASLDSSGEKISSQLSEIDLSDPEDVKALIPEQGVDILVHFGDEKYLGRYRNFVAHLAQWRQQYPRLASVDMRYDGQAVLEMQQGTGTVPAASAANGSNPATPAKPSHPSVVRSASEQKPHPVAATRKPASKKPATVAHKTSAPRPAHPHASTTATFVSPRAKATVQQWANQHTMTTLPTAYMAAPAQGQKK